jgi:hypothetical protein
MPKRETEIKMDHQVRKDVTEKEGKTWEEIEEEDRSCGKTDRWRGLVVRQPT